MSMLKKTILIVISVCLVSLFTLPLNGYCDDWIFIDRSENMTYLYKSSSVKIDNKNKTIKVWVKDVYTEKGKITFLKNKDSIEKQKYIDINNRVGLLLFDYKERKYSINHLTFYSKSGNVLYDEEYPPEWKNITPDSTLEILLNKLLKDYTIQR